MLSSFKLSKAAITTLLASTTTAKLEIFFHVLVYSCQPIVASVRFKVPQAVVRSQSGPTDLTVLTIGSALSKGWRSGPEAFRAGHYKDLTETGKRTRKVSGTQGIIRAAT